MDIAQAASSPTPPRTPWVWRAALIAASAFIILGIKLWLIGSYASEVPSWDQWDAEADFLYRPYLRGELRIADFFAFHNEHRIFWTRLLSLAELRVYGSWQPLFQMKINAVVHVVAIGLLLAMLGSALTMQRFVAFWALSLAVFSIPFGWENTVNGFHAQWYFLILFSLISVCLVIRYPAFSWQWSIGTLAAAAAYFASASGALTPLAIATLCAAQIVLGRRKGKLEWAGIIALLSLFLLAAADVFHSAPRGVATLGLGQFHAALISAAAYPFSDGGILAALLLYAPVVALVIWTLQQAPPLHHGSWMILGVTAWVASQVAAIAYGRPPETILSSRYLDIYLIVTLTGLASTLLLLDGKRKFVAMVASTWMALVFSAVGLHWSDAMFGIKQKRDQGQRQTESVQNYLRTGDIADLMPPNEIPYPIPSRLAAVISLPEIKMILPRDLQPSATKGWSYGDTLPID